MRAIAIISMIACSTVTASSALTPGDLSRVQFEQHPGQQISPSAVFRDETGRSFTFGELFGKEPIIVVPGYYRCPMLCRMINDGLINTLENLQASVGKDFRVVDVSIDPDETPSAAAERKALYLRRYGRAGAANGWHCLLGDAKSIAQLTDEIGFRYAYDTQIRQFAHPSGIVVLTPTGKISRYIFGATFDATELRDALKAAKEEKQTPVLSQLFLVCFHYNPVTGKYGALVLSTLRIVSLGFVALVAWWIFSMSRRSANRSAQAG